MITKAPPQDLDDISSERVSIPGRGDGLIIGYMDAGPESFWNGRVVMLAPKYGETKKNNLRLAYFLVANGFKVLRFDHTNHIGESDGEMHQFDLPSAVVDILDVLNYIENHFEPEEIVLVANSLSARCAYRAAALDQRISRLVCVVGVVNLQQTIKNIYRKDIIGRYLEGKLWGVIDILGFDIDSANFISKLAEAEMHDLEGTVKDAAKIKKPLLHLVAAKDMWVDQHEVAKVTAKSEGQLIEIEEAYHEIGENPEAARKTMEHIARFCMEGLADVPDPLNNYNKKQLVEQNRKERRRLREMYSIKESENEFWNGYLGKFGTIEQASVYIDYFEKVRLLMGNIREHDVILDAGCGNGFLGLSLLHAFEAAHLAKSDLPEVFSYFAIDLTPGGLEQSYQRQAERRMRLLREQKIGLHAATFAYQRFDFDTLKTDEAAFDEGSRLPLATDSVDKVCSSLVVSYLKEPVTFIRELRRILKPGGIAVLSSMKPECDLTVLFHEFISNEAGEEELAMEAQQLLGAAGRIKLKEQSGIYGFYTEEEMVSMVKAAGFSLYDTMRSLGNQANVVRVQK